ncbi:Small-conductance mechanosensitive channel [Devosia crocina]|uniref:Small-conductance mechanosensitive channel n=1 Tax=Devosia crocina TaxID=429728 RepID=A0A1I7MW54_9HYPH|nr:mechanosensitive ion channel domain-containing protein [Devosia crocina]SFV26595.1 Small-conductance mechanosensitive channel [Devosia crocina]
MPLLRLVGLLLLAALATPGVFAQDAAPPAASRSEVVDSLITVLESESLRQQLLEQLRALPPASAAEQSALPGSAEETPPDVQPTEPGLVDALSLWSDEVLTSLPTTTFGMRIDQKAQQAGAQIANRIEAGLDSGRLLGFAVWAGPFLLLLVLGSVLVRRVGRQLVAPVRPVRKRRLAFGLVLRILAHIALFILVVALVGTIAPDEAAASIFITLAVGLILALLTTDFVISGLSSLAAWRGRRIVWYCQIRFYPWLLSVLLAAVFAALGRDPSLRRTIGWSAADLAGFVLNLTAAILVLVFVYRHKRAIGRLIFGPRARAAASANPFHIAMIRLSRHWHLLAYGFLVLSIVSIFAGQRDNDILTLMLWSFGVVLIALVLISVLNRFFAPRQHSFRDSQLAVRQVITNGVFRVLRILCDTVISIAALCVIAWIWGFNIWHWAITEGRPITGPLMAAGACIALAWLIWVALDAWIASVLTPRDGLGWSRRRSSRVQTLLPLLRNGVMIVLIVLAAIAVLANIGVDVTPLIAGAGVFGLALSFGSQQLVQDVITGIFILAEDTIAIGDTVSTGDRSGVVESISLRTIRLRDADGALHSIPFSTVKALKNSSRNFGVLRPRYTVPAAVDPDIFMTEMRETAATLRTDTRFAGAILSELTDLGIDEINTGAVVVSGALRTSPPRQTEIARAFNGLLLHKLGEKGISL